MAKESDVPQPGPARLAKGAGPDEWLEAAKQCKYLPEADMKRLCEIVKECLMEGEITPSTGRLECKPSPCNNHIKRNVRFYPIATSSNVLCI